MTTRREKEQQQGIALSLAIREDGVDVKQLAQALGVSTEVAARILALLFKAGDIDRHEVWTEHPPGHTPRATWRYVYFCERDDS